MAQGVFCAIDTHDASVAERLVKDLSALPVHFKLGLEFFTAHGIAGVLKLRAAMPVGAKVFLDLKLHDIPNTVAGALRAAMKCRPDFVTLHASGGKDMLRAALLAAKEEEAKTGNTAPALLGVTVLTHLDERDLETVGQKTPPEEQVLRLGSLCREAGLAGLVCSPHEIARLRAELGRNLMLVVPGIRPRDTKSQDQKRVMTPCEALRLGADYLVIGRPITEAPNPAQAAADILSSFGRCAA